MSTRKRLIIAIALWNAVAIALIVLIDTTFLHAMATPVSGKWIGLASNGRKMEFQVAADGSFVTKLSIFVTDKCAVSTGDRQLTITNDRFSHSDPLIKVSGQFSGTTAASGTYQIAGSSTFCIYPDQSGTWTAQAPPPPVSYLPLVLNQQATITPTITPTPTLFAIDGRWRGQSTQNNDISFEIKDHGFISFTTSYQIGGCGGSSSTFGGTIPIIGNTFVYGQAGANGAFILTTGTFDSDTTVAGTIKVTGSPCGNSEGAWTATKEGQDVHRIEHEIYTLISANSPAASEGDAALAVPSLPFSPPPRQPAIIEGDTVDEEVQR